MNIKEDEAKNLDTLLDEIIRNKGKSEFDYRDILFKGESDDFIINLVTKLNIAGVINTVKTVQGRCLIKTDYASTFLSEGSFADRYNEAEIEFKKQEEKDNLQMQHLRSSVQQIVSEIIDAPKVIKNMNLSFIINLIAVAISLGSMIVAIIALKRH